MLGCMANRQRGGIMRIFLSTLGVFFLMSFLFIMPAVWGPSTTPQPSASPVLSAAPTPSPAAAQEIRAVWVSFLEWQHTDFSSESAFRADAAAIMQNIASLGANTVFAHVRPFGDALYPSRYFPFSHLCTGTQGQDPGFDPLAVLVETPMPRALRWKPGSTPTACRPTEPRLSSAHKALLCCIPTGSSTLQPACIWTPPASKSSSIWPIPSVSYVPIMPLTVFILMITFTPLLPRILMPTVMPQAAAPSRWPIGGGKM